MENRISDVNRMIYWIVIPFGMIILLIQFEGIFKPMLSALVIWFLISFVKSIFSKIKINGKTLPHWTIGILSLLAISFLIFGLIEILSANIKLVINNFATYEETLGTMLNNLGKKYNIERTTANVDFWVESLNIKSFLSNTLASISSAVGNVILIVIYVVFMILEEAHLQNKLDFIYEDYTRRTKAKNMLNQIYIVSKNYMALKTFTSLLTGVISYVIMLVLGLNHAFLWAILIFLFNYIPYIGSLIATLIPSIFAIVQFGNPMMAIWVFLSIESVQVLVGNIIEPRIMGSSLNLSPLVIVIALSVWGYIWGVFGMLISVPITSIIIIVVAQFPDTRNAAILCTQNGDIEKLILKDDDA